MTVLLIVLLLSLVVSLSLSEVLNTLKYNSKIKVKYINIIEQIIKDNEIEFNKKGISVNDINKLILSLQQDSLSLLNINNNNNYNSIINNNINKWDDLISLSYCDYIISRYISIDIINYKETGIDPYLNSKYDDLASSQAFIEDVCLRINDIIDLPIEDALITALHISLWSSKKDCGVFSSDSNVASSSSSSSSLSSSSKGTIEKKRNTFFAGLNKRNNNILDDQSHAVVDYLKSLVSSSSSEDIKDIGIVTGKTGKELFADLLLAHVLLCFKVCNSVTFYCRDYPCIHNGVTATDIYGHIEHLADRSKSNVWSVHILGNGLRNHLQLDKIRIVSDEYWCNQHQSFKEISPSVKEQAANSKLIIIKGDSNYQKIVDCQDWSTTVDQDIHNLIDPDWIKIPLCIITPIQSENVYGVPLKEIKRASSYDMNFTKDGNFGLIQFKK